MARWLRIVGGLAVDPGQGWDRAAVDLLVQDGRIAAAVERRAPAAVSGPLTSQDQASLPAEAPPWHAIPALDATGCVVLAGGVEPHAHIASPSIDACRAIQSTSGYAEVAPSAPITGRRYAAMGYTLAVEPAVAPSGTDLAHAQLDDLPHLDTGLLVLVGNHLDIIELLNLGQRRQALERVRELLIDSRAMGIKAVNPAAVEAWRREPARRWVRSAEEPIPGSRVSPLSLAADLAGIAQDLGLGHPLHLHGPRLGQPGNVDITLDMLRGLSGQRLHLAHLQYYCYGPAERGEYVSAVPRLLEFLQGQPNVTADLGLISFGPAFTATADLPLEHALYSHIAVPGRPASFYDSANEDCFGVMPLVHSPRSPAAAVQWATGLELALRWPDLSRLSLTVDHPNGGSFMNYPDLIALLMSKDRRAAALAQCHPAATQRTGLAAIDRELTLSEIATLTRVAPARALGLRNKGTLAVGCDADIAVYPDAPRDMAAMLRTAKHVVKAGRAIVENGQIASDSPGKRMAFA